MPSHCYTAEVPLSVFDEDDLIDDSYGITPMAGLGKPLSLRNRFLRRLSKMIGADVTMQEDEPDVRLDIYLTWKPNQLEQSPAVDKELREYLSGLKDAWAIIAMHQCGLRYDRAREDLWDTVLIYVYCHIDYTIIRLQQCFSLNQPILDDFITTMFGVHENTGSERDCELGDQLIAIQEMVQGYDSSVKQLNTLIQFASRMTRTLSHLQNRLKYLLGKPVFAKEIFQLICAVGFPERAYSTFVRAAKASTVFTETNFHIRLRQTSPTQPLPQQTISTAMLLPRPPLQGKSQATRQALATPLPLLIQTDYADYETSLGAARPFLQKEDRVIGFVRLPAAKRDTVQLIRSVLPGKLVPISSSAFYIFGFVTCDTEDQERHLAGFYAWFLEQARHRRSTFQSLTTAVETNTLADLLNIKNLASFNDYFPRLETFLSAVPTPTVWRLKQFIQDETTDEPPPCLKRDYGFYFCTQREDVAKLKTIYTAILDRVAPLELHAAAINGQLLAFAIQELGVVDPNMRRFLQNDFGVLRIGFDDMEGLERHRKPLFKKVQREV
ncbi:hypothetical protein P153DRAFT_431611 [Dothidotthia symphoricarpi CBS 119687]|uniref:Uncharacterized protein n=1 Tax=Dothidotthia symphoricarpi CBS 119687 TaxID=1392245 RepID=A0A6A6ACT0_9PLEO|nr:uncharacterized protein P153DRAFT_431611 [Dothidotthia symphoricarpi CBS 119687]KAF2128718.1 hypothetical protein P153DRAFT_431611 [Dothidotthia symphoricarpi CBS 119687]